MSVKVKVVGRQGKSALVEYWEGDKLRRCYLPVEQINEGEVANEELEAGIPYGVAWEEHIVIGVTPETIAQNLRRRGIWTIKDANEKPNMVVLALQESYGIDARLIRLIKE